MLCNRHHIVGDNQTGELVMKNRGVESLAAVAARRAQHEAYLSAGRVMVMGLNGKMSRRMIRTGVDRRAS